MFNANTLLKITQLGWSLVGTKAQTKNGTLVFEKDSEQLAAYPSGWLRRKNLNQPSPYAEPRFYQIHKKRHANLEAALDAMLAYITKFNK